LEGVIYEIPEGKNILQLRVMDSFGNISDTANLEILRKDYTTDDTNDNGIKNTIIVSTVLNNSEYSFYANLSNISYNFEYNITFNQ
jgi:hypothetical protein